jgi:hypothetical protein
MLLFNIISLLLDTFRPAICKILNAVGEKKIVGECKASYAPPLSARHQLQISDFLEHS